MILPEDSDRIEWNNFYNFFSLMFFSPADVISICVNDFYKTHYM